MSLRVAVIGTGYVGLVSAVCLAAKGHKIICVDANPEVVRRVGAGEPHIYERGLPELLASVIAAGTFRITSDLDSALAEADGVLIAVGTPTEHGKIDLRYIEEAASGIGLYFKKSGRFLPVVVKSTVLPGVTDTVVRGILEKTSGKGFGDFGLGMNRNFFGKAMQYPILWSPTELCSETRMRKRVRSWANYIHRGIVTSST